MKEHSRILKPTQHYLTASASIFCILLKSFGVLLVMGFMCLNAYADALPKSLLDAVAQVETDEAEKAFGVLSRYAYTDNQEQRLIARTALAQLDREAGRLDRALTWVGDYQNPQPENFEWPRVNAYVESAKIQFMRGNAFESVKRLTDAKDKSSGLAKVSVERALSWVMEQKPDLKQALAYEKSALKSGEGYFKRKKISDTAGLEPSKPGTEIWKELKPEIETRIADLERKIRIDSYGLDFVLYSEAQVYRNASHPLALDFTNVAAAFDQKGEIGGQVPDADYELAVEKYNEILKYFPQNPYGQAAKLYIAVCTAKTGDPDGAIKQLKAFYKEDPDGLYRGEALTLIGDLYLFAKWDQNNAKEAYERAIRWVEATETRTRVLDTYLVPEKSAEVSKPPKVVKILTKEGEIKRIKVPEDALVNRLTSLWYLDSLKVNAYWNLGFLALTEDDWDLAFKHFDVVLGIDKILKTSHEENYVNAYARLLAAKKNGTLVGVKEQMRGLKGEVKTVMMWGDFQYLLEQFDRALSLFMVIQSKAPNERDGIVITRATLGEMLVRRVMKEVNPKQDVTRMHQLVEKYPQSPSAPYLLELCASLTEGDPEPQKFYRMWIYLKYPQTLFALRARYNEVLAIDWEDQVAWTEAINEFKKDFPERNDYHEALLKLQIRIQEILKEKKLRHSI